MALVTITDDYKAFLKGIKKKNSSAVWPADFNDIINRAYKEWLSQKSEESDIVQKRIDDLQKLRYVTDGTIEILLTDVTIDAVGGEFASDSFNTVTGIRTIITIDTVPAPDHVRTRTYQRLIPIAPIIGSGILFPVLPVNYPSYFRLQSILVMVTSNGIDYGYIGSVPMKDDRKAIEIQEDPYSVPYVDINDLSRSRIYHQYLQDRLQLYLPSGFVGKNIQVSYIKLPRELFYDVNNPINNIDCELGPIQQQQIVDIAVRIFLEEIESPRYRTKLTEEQIKQNSN